MKKILTGIVGLICVVSLVGCNTTRGVGQDVESAGEGLQRASDNAR